MYMRKIGKKFQKMIQSCEWKENIGIQLKKILLKNHILLFLHRKIRK